MDHSKICGRQPLTNLDWYGLPKQTIPLQIFQRLSATNFTWSNLVILNLQKRIQNPIKHLRWNFWQKIVNNLQLLITFAKSSILDVWLTSAYDVFKFSSNSAVPEILKFKRPNLRLVVFMFDKNLYLFIGFYIKNRASWRSCLLMLVMSVLVTCWLPLKWVLHKFQSYQRVIIKHLSIAQVGNFNSWNLTCHDRKMILK